MRKFAFLTLGLTGLLLGTPSCGKDEATGDGGGRDLADHCEVCSATNDCQSDYVCKRVGAGTAGAANGRCADTMESQCCVDGQCYTLGATIGAGGSGGGGILGGGGGGGKAGTTGKGGSGGGSNIQSGLGKACTEDSECGDARLTCLTSGGLADGSGPPKGLCTLACQTDGACLEFSDDAFCVEIDTDLSYCIEGCATGSMGVPKCHSRTEFSCSLLGVTTGGTTACVDSGDCGANQLCNDDDVCGDIVTACLPTCGGDFDCAAGQFCDFASGWCSDTDPTGLPIGAPCDPRITTDPCDGFCVPTNDAGTQGKCEAFCTISSSPIGCGWDGEGPADAACLFGTILSPPNDYAPGDLGICGQLCDCNDECRIPNEYCIDESAGDIFGIWSRNGYCRELAPGETVADTFDECPEGSSGGAGGQSGGQSGGGGAAGEATGSAGESTSGAGGEAGAGQGGQGGA